jgi:hypothetical protein
LEIIFGLFCKSISFFNLYRQITKPMKKSGLFLILIILIAHQLRAQNVISSTFIQAYSKAQVDSIYTANGLPSFLLPIRFDIEIYQVVYETVSFDGSNTFASGALVVPVNPTCKMPLVSYQHGTVQKASDAPSFNKGEIIIGISLAADGYAVSMPDYLGLGITNINLHPYIHAQSEATAAIDMLRASKTVVTGMGKELNDQLFLVGYSQGGHATMALHRMIEQQFSSEFTVTASAPMSGPYDISGVQAQVITNDSVYSQPAFLPFVLFGLNQVYNFFTNPSNILTSPYDAIIPPLMNGNYGTSDLNNVMPAQPNQIIDPAVLDSFRTEPNHYFRLGLAQNDVYDWLPVSPIRMFYCEADEQVAYQNTFVAYNKFIQNGATNVSKVSAGPLLDHGGCARIALILGKVWFDSLRTDFIKSNYSIVSESTPGAGNGSISATITGGLSPLQFAWSNGATTQSISGLQGGQYIITITSANNCVRTDTIFVPTVTGLNESILTADQIIVLPNPFHDKAEINLSGFDLKNYFNEVFVEDISGKRISVRTILNKESVIIYRENLQNGVYLIRLKGKAGEVVKKVMVY